jgi:hypothetical protein
LHKKDDLRPQLFVALEVLRSLPESVTASVGEQLAAGLAKIVMERPDAFRSVPFFGASLLAISPELII